MFSASRPKTAEEIATLPEAGFGQESRVINGKRIAVPFVEETLIVSDDGGPMNYVDHDGRTWWLRQFPDGRYCRSRI